MLRVMIKLKIWRQYKEIKKIEPGFTSDGKFRKIISDYNSIPIATYLFEKLGISDETFQTKFRDIKT